jgi:transcriptional regulator with XRE-family HTH domain
MDINKIATLKALGFLVRKHREKLHISQEELATRSNLDRTYISGIERGVRNPSLTALLSLANGLGISISQLLENLELGIKDIR